MIKCLVWKLGCLFIYHLCDKLLTWHAKSNVSWNLLDLTHAHAPKHLERRGRIWKVTGQTFYHIRADQRDLDCF